MIIAVKASPAALAEWNTRVLPAGVTLTLITGTDLPIADLYVDLTPESDGSIFRSIKDQPILLNAVIRTCAELHPQASRFNGWPGFIARPVLEVVTKDEALLQCMAALGWSVQQVPDVPGMIAPRTISMIVNEAYFAMGEGVSAPSDIDTAMKLGTNYPFGPFEWAERIGLHQVYQLLRRLSESDARYAPAPALEQSLKSIA